MRGLKTGVRERDRRSVALDDRCLVVGTYGARCTQPFDQRRAIICRLADVDGATETDPGFSWSQAMRRYDPSVVLSQHIYAAKAERRNHFGAGDLGKRCIEDHRSQYAE